MTTRKSKRPPTSGTSAFLRYALKDYAMDLERFRATLSGEEPNETLRAQDRSDKVIVINDADHSKWLAAFAQAKLEDRRRFVVVVFLEGTLLAAVHQYDSRNYGKYTDALPRHVFVENFGDAGVRRPHILLAGLNPWTATSTKLVVQGCVALLPEWARAYSRLVKSSGAGERVVRALARDPDLTQNPYDFLPPAAMEALETGLQRAARACAGTGKSPEP